jgi:hypothetical protein
MAKGHSQKTKTKENENEKTHDYACGSRDCGCFSSRYSEVGIW